MPANVPANMPAKWKRKRLLIGSIVIVGGLCVAAGFADSRHSSHRHRSWNIPPGIEKKLERQAEKLIAISETYVDALTVPGNEGVLLHPDVRRWTQQNIAEPPRNDDRDALLQSIAEEDLDGEITNRRWTVDVVRQETFMIADIVLEGLPLPITLYERFLIEDGLILEIEAIFLSPF